MHHDIHALEILGEDSICALSGRLINIATNWQLEKQRSVLAREDEIRKIDRSTSGEKGFRLERAFAFSG
jgi:hypothetical protein